MDILFLILQLYFAAVLGVSGIAKIDNPYRFAFTLRRHNILPAKIIPIVSWIVPWLEIVVAALLLAGVAAIPTAIVVMSLFVSFLITEVVLALSKPATECGCYGAAFPQRVDSVSVMVLVIQVFLAAFYLWGMTWIEPVSIEWRALWSTLLGGIGLWLLVTVVRRRIRLSKTSETSTCPCRSRGHVAPRSSAAH